MRLHQQTPDCADFDIILTGESSPAFRVLLPEWIRGQGVNYQGLCHVIPGVWHEVKHGIAGHYFVGAQLEISMEIETRETEILVDFRLKNNSLSDIQDIWANVCTAVNHLPGNPGWSNDTFLPSVPLDRAVQGRYWFETVTPKRLFAFTARGWLPMHPCPDRPDASSVPLYSFVPSSIADTKGCAIESPSGGIWCFQAWNTMLRYCTPCPGNACMHLEPFLAKVLAPCQTVDIRGLVGIHRGERNSLMEKIEEFLQSNPTTTSN